MHPTVIIGGGVIGLSVAWYLGEPVVVLDPGEAGGAWRASAGMLAPLAEEQSGPMLDLGLASLRAYPAFLQEISLASGTSVSICGPGMLRVDPHGRDAILTRARTHGIAAEIVATKELEPALAADQALFTPDEKHVDPRDLVNALASAVRGAGGSILTERAVDLVVEGRDRIVAVRTPQNTIPCHRVLIAAGAWSDTFAGRLGITFGAHPVRGQIVTLRPRTVVLQHTTYSHDVYLVPRGEVVFVGATEERVGFDSRVTAEGVAGLVAAAIRLVPALADAEFVRASAGLRPGSPDGLPIIGAVPGWTNVYIATGHFRNGILLAPITGSLVAEIMSGRVPELAQPFTPERVTVRA